MIGLLEGISQEEYNTLQKSLSLITVLVASADGKIDKNEIDDAEKVVHIRSFNKPELLKEFYQDVETHFHADLDEAIEEYGDGTEESRNRIINRLKVLNTILPKIEDPSVRYYLYNSLKSFAKHIAKSSGGIFGFLSIGPKEDHYIDLEFIDPIAKPIE